ncbi:MAG: hypothetical protein U0894_13105 [Pirellulales bacterium]
MSHGIPFTAEQVRAVQSGEARGFGPGLVRFLMTLGTIPYVGAVLLKNCLYDTGLLRAQKVEAAVLSVGNLTTGGTQDAAGLLPGRMAIERGFFATAGESWLWCESWPAE